MVRATAKKDGTPYQRPDCNLNVEKHFLTRARNINAAAERGPHPATAEEAAAGKFDKY